MFRDREDAAHQLVAQLRGYQFLNPLVLAIPRGGVPVGAVLADELPAELDVVLSRKLRAPFQPELAIGAICEGGEVYLNPHAEDVWRVNEHYLESEKQYQLVEIARRAKLIRRVRPRAKVAGRSVIVTDDGIATGSTIIAALQLLRSQSPYELIVAVPVASPERLPEVSRWCDRTICVHLPEFFYAIGQFYEDFRQIDDQEVITILRSRYTHSHTIDEVALDLQKSAHNAADRA
jgi:putative phosphoribosyl transferase